MSKNNRTGNLVKSYFLNRDMDESRIIDSNAIVEEKLERIRMVMPTIAPKQEYYEEESYAEGSGEFEGGLNADMLDALTGDGEYEVEYDEEGNPVSNVIKAAPVSEEYDEQPQMMPQSFAPVFDGPSPEELIERAKAEIETMKIEARVDIDREKTIGYEEGKKQGYAEGMAEAREDAARMREELENERRLMEEDYASRIADLEPQFVHTLTSIYEKIFEVDLSEHKEIIISLLRNAISKIEGSGNYMIHVSREDYPYVLEHKEEILEKVTGTDVTVDIVEDVTMKVNDCMIETQNGIFDCSLGTELEQLRRRLELLSFEG